MLALSEIILATGALGTAAFGIVEALKFTRLGEAGVRAVFGRIGKLNKALGVAYGTRYEELIRGQYRGDAGELARTLRQGVRVGLTVANARDIALDLGSLDPTALEEAVSLINDGKALKPAHQNVIGRYELAADARIDAALAVARAHYIGASRVAASGVAILLALLAGWQMSDLVGMFEALLIGVAAVPLAPIAKDVASGIQAASKAIKARA